MHKAFYASGFLFDLSSQQILLQQITDSSGETMWSMFGRNARSGKTGKEHFKDIFLDELSITLNESDIYEVYSYESPVFKNTQVVYYAEIFDPSFVTEDNPKYRWFTFKQIQKLPLVPQAKHDIMISKRVIDSSSRKKLGEHTLE
jgi:hypothetical protein